MRLTQEHIAHAKAAYIEGGYEAARAALDADGIGTDTIVLPELFNDVINLLPMLYNPADKGRWGKIGEVEERVTRWQESGRSWAHWGEFHARKSGRADVGNNTEMKTGAGDWLYSYTHSTVEDIIAEYATKQTFIRWATSDFIIECTWQELLEYLAEYSAKGLATWFKSNVKYNSMISKTVVMMQEYRTSKKKLAYLQNCPYCE